MPRLTPAVLRTLDILELFLDDAEPLTAPEVARRTELPRSTVHELLATLVSRDYLRRDEATGTYALGVRLLQLGNAYSMRFDLLGAANEVARELSARTGETVSVALREGAEVLYLAKIEIREFTVGVSNIGQRLPANCTGLGKALLAAVPEAKLTGLYADPEHLPVMTEHSLSTLEKPRGRPARGTGARRASPSSTRSRNPASAARRPRCAAPTARSWPPSACRCRRCDGSCSPSRTGPISCVRARPDCRSSSGTRRPRGPESRAQPGPLEWRRCAVAPASAQNRRAWPITRSRTPAGRRTRGSPPSRGRPAGSRSASARCRRMARAGARTPPAATRPMRGSRGG